MGCTWAGAAEEALRAEGDEVVGVQGLEELGRLLGPGLQAGPREVALAARLVAQLPRHDRRVVPVTRRQADVGAQPSTLDYPGGGRRACPCMIGSYRPHKGLYSLQEHRLYMQHHKAACSKALPGSVFRARTCT